MIHELMDPQYTTNVIHGCDKGRHDSTTAYFIRKAELKRIKPSLVHHGTDLAVISSFCAGRAGVLPGKG